MERSATRRRTAGDQRGVTLIEILVALAIVGIIGPAVATALITILRTDAAVSRTLLRSNEAQAVSEAWTHDVQSVAADGVNTGPSCAPATDTVLVTFAQSDPAAGGTQRIITWSAQRSRGRVTISRWSCAASGAAGGPLVLGLRGSSIGKVVHGPGGVGSFDFCPPDAGGIKRTCTIAIDAENKYSLTVTRRVPDLSAAGGTPLPAPAPVLTAHEARYRTIAVTWAPSVVATGQPAVDQYRITLYQDADGDGTPVATVDVGSGTLTTTFTNLIVGRWYYVRTQAANAIGWGEQSDVHGPMMPIATPPAAPVITSAVGGDGTVTVAWTASTDNGGDPLSGNVWHVTATPVGGGANVGPVTTPAGVTSFTLPGLTNFVPYQVTVAGQNSVGTGPASAPSATFMPTGGTTFVKASGTDSASCGTLAAPCATIGQGLTRSVASGTATVAVAGGTYPQFSMVGGRTVWGGFGQDLQSRPAGETTRITGAWDSSASLSYGVRVNGVTQAATLKDLQIDGANVSSTAGRPAQGVVVTSSSGAVNLVGVTIDGGSGAHPTGLLVRGSQVSVQISNINSGTTATNAPGSSAYGIRALASSNVTVTGSTVISSSGQTGTTGTAGTAGSTNPCNGNATTAQAGATGGCTPSPGGGGGGAGSDADGSPAAVGGSAGSAAGPAAGGSGGVAGSNNNASCSFYSGGGAGGTGGGGGAGTGGGAGGAGARQEVAPTAISGELWAGGNGGTGTGGTGGAGGGGGGGGGRGRSAGLFSCTDNRGGGGGAGGGGGQAGGTAGGGGGAGGGSFAVFSKDSTVTISGSTLTAGGGAGGGAGGAGGKGNRGGNGGNGSGATSNGGAGGRGGGGGGSGGAGGGAGGQGGPSITAIRIGSGTVTVDAGTTLNRAAAGANGGTGGSGGAGGDGGIGGNNGTTGATGGAGQAGTAGTLCRLWNGATCTTA